MPASPPPETYAAGSEAYIGYAAQTDKDTVASAPTAYIPVNPDQINLVYNNGRTANKLAVASLYSNHSAKQGRATSSGSITVPFFPTLCSGLLALCGCAGGPITKPQYITLFWGQFVDEEIFGGMRCKQVEVTGDSNKGWEIKFDFDGIMPSTFGAVRAPTYTEEEQYEWQDFQPMNIVASTGLQDIDKVRITFDMPTDPFFGNHGKPTPSHQTPIEIDAKGAFTKVHEDHVDATNFNNQCGVPGAMSHVLTSTCSGTPVTHTIAIPRAFYTKRTPKTPQRATNTEDYEWESLRVNTGASEALRAPATWVQS